MSRTSNWIVLAAASLVVIVLIAWMAGAWTDFGDAGMSAAGWFAMALGIFVTLALGIGLMALVFISHRRGYDEGGHHGR
jgi:cation transporter-like permease